uniref:CCR3 n=1 Tax=Arundo donax TaxID=35708 RepID=A0A0A9CK15_ARUDO
MVAQRRAVPAAGRRRVPVSRLRRRVLVRGGDQLLRSRPVLGPAR